MVNVNVSKVNWKLLRRQKLALLRAIEEKDTGKDKKDRDLLQGLLSLVDDIQDQTAEVIGEKAVFGKLDAKARELYPIEDWQYEVANGDTTLGYKEWVQHNK